MTLHKPLRFGIKTAPRDIEVLREVWQEAESISVFEHAWVSDHLISFRETQAQPCLESWTLLAFLAAETRRLRIGVMVTGNTYRHPAVLAKMATNVDLISRGRLNFGLGTGWDPIDHQTFGLPFPSPGERVRRFGEACELIHRLWTEPAVTFEGRYYQVQDAQCVPRPLQKPHPPFVLAGEGEQTLRVIARYADVWDCSVDPIEAYRQKSSILENYCAAIGRDPAAIERSRHISVDPANLQTTLQETRAFIEAGATHIIYSVAGPEILHRLAEEIVSPLRAEYDEATLQEKEAVQALESRQRE